MEITYYIDEIGGRRLGYNSKTKFVIEVSKGKGAYKTKHRVTGNFRKALTKYNAIDSKVGSRKRLLMIGATDPVLVKGKC